MQNEQLIENTILNNFRDSLSDPDDKMMFDELLKVKKNNESVQYTIDLFKQMISI